MNQQLTLSYPDMEASSKGKAIGNRKCLEQFDKFNQVGAWAKTYANLLISQNDWFSMTCKLTWKLRATKSHRFYFQLFPSNIEDLLPTPTTQEATSECEVNENGRRVTTDGQNSHSLNIGRMATMGMLPTPTAFDWNSARTEKKWEEDKAMWAERGVNLQMPLKQMARLKLLPTPKAVEAPSASWDKRSPNSKFKPGVTLTDLKVWGMLPTPTKSDFQPRWKTENWEGSDLGSQINQMLGTRSHLSPQFVLEMMGFPTDWTLLPFLNKEKCN
jgi:hypothetical protein